MYFAQMLLQTQTVAPHPWLYSANLAILRSLFKILPHSYLHDSVAEFLVLNPILSTWVFGIAFFLYWRPHGMQTDEHRHELAMGVLSFMVAIGIGLLLSLWIQWPAPARTAELRSLYPPDFWRVGSNNSFPSTSTLLYFTIALSFWSISRRLSMLLLVQTLVTVSLPRMYMGGHYPIDVGASIVLSLASFAAVRIFLSAKWDKIKNGLDQVPLPSTLHHVVLFIWVFELANGFHATEGAVASILHVSRHLAAN